MEQYADVAFRRRIPPHNDGLFTFRIPAGLTEKIDLGCVVIAPLQGKHERTVVVRLHADKPHFKTEAIAEVVTPALLTPEQFVLAEKTARKNFVQLAKVVPLLLPQKIFDGNGMPPQKQLVGLAADPASEEYPRGKKMVAVLEHLRKGKSDLTEVKEATGADRSTLDRLAGHGLIEYSSVPMYQPWSGKVHNVPELSAQQQEAVREIETADHDKPFLLFAPTGSGKSHSIRALAAELINAGKSVFLLVPEIGLTSELVQKCQELFGKEAVTVLHSRLAEGERAAVYWRIKTGAAKVIVGSRMALFSPFRDLGLVVVEEEHEWTLKSDQAPRYHGRDVAEELAKTHRAKLIFSTATPSLETWHRAETQKLNIVSLPTRATPPKLNVVDIREEVLAKNNCPVSRDLQHKMRLALEHGSQVLLFLNRRGLHRVLLCRSCGETVRNPENGLSLVVHSGNGREFLLCHQTGKVFAVPAHCPHCGSTELAFAGSGTAGIERVTQTLFPGKKVVRIDRDTTSTKKGFDTLHEQFASGEADILVGTQIIGKGLDFSNIGVVGIIDADSGLNIPDFRAAERTFQLLTQVAGRGGRRGQATEIVIQTRLPEHPVIKALAQNDLQLFYRQESEVREKFFLPPYSRIIKLIFTGVGKEAVYRKARETEAMIKNSARQRFAEENIVVSVAPALTPRKHGKYYVNLLVTAKDPEKIIRAIPLGGCRIDNDPVDVVG